jgi:hypothetical protein
MAKKISDCEAARVHFSYAEDAKGNRKSTWRVNWKTEGIWCNSEEELIAALRQIETVKKLGEKYKPWKLGEGGWNKNPDYKETKE